MLSAKQKFLAIEALRPPLPPRSANWILCGRRTYGRFLRYDWQCRVCHYRSSVTLARVHAGIVSGVPGSCPRCRVRLFPPRTTMTQDGYMIYDP